MAATKNGEPNYWVLVLANKNQANSHYNAQVIFDAQVKRKAWGLKEESRNFDEIRKGDICLLYIGSPYCVFAGYAIAKGKPDSFDKIKRNKYLDKVYKRKPKAGVEFSKVIRFDVQVPVPLLTEELPFIKKPKNWGMYFQGSIKRLDKLNFELILSVACMLNTSLQKRLKPRVKTEVKATFNTDQRTTH